MIHIAIDDNTLWAHLLEFELVRTLYFAVRLRLHIIDSLQLDAVYFAVLIRQYHRTRMATRMRMRMNALFLIDIFAGRYSALCEHSAQLFDVLRRFERLNLEVVC